MRNKVLILILLMLSCINSYAQRNNAGISLFNSKGSAYQEKTASRPSSASSGNKFTKMVRESKSDIIDRKPILCRNIVKRNGWIEGISIISKETAKYMSCYIRLSNMNKAGHWTHVEALDGNGDLTVNHGIGAYALPKSSDPSDSTANAEWKEKIASICKWDFAYDENGDKVVMERAYDANDNLIYAFTPIQYNDSVFIGSYIDAWGRPANLRGEDGSSLVRITRDKRGFDIKIELLDELGNNIPNENGVFVAKYDYYDNGTTKSNMSCNIYGEPIIDNCGNCGVIAEYDKNLLLKSETSIGPDRKPLRIPMSDRNQGVDWIKREYKYDNYGRETEILYLDGNNREDHNTLGIVKTELIYGNSFQPEWIINKGTDNKLVDDSNFAIAHFKYNAGGYTVLQEYFDKDSIPVNVPEIGACKITWQFDEKNNYKYQEQHKYQYIDNTLQEVYTYKVSGDTIYEEFSPKDIYTRLAPDYTASSIKTPCCNKYYRFDGIVMVDSLDRFGNIYYENFVNQDGTPAVSNRGWSSCRINYSYKDKSGKNFTTVTQWKNLKGAPLEYQIKDVDSKKCTLIQKNINLSDEVIFNKLTVYTDSTMEIPRKDVSLNNYGTTSRSLKNGNLFLNMEYNFTDNTKQISSVVGKNEFGEPAYICNQFQGWAYYYYLNNKKNSRITFDEHGDTITEMYDFYKALPKVPCIEVIDSTGYQQGFKDGDIILQYGTDWHYPLKEKCTVLTELYLQQVLASSGKKNVKVLRHHPEQHNSEVIELELHSGTLSQNGMIIHELCYTQRELERLTSTLGYYLKNNNMEWTENAQRDNMQYKLKLFLPNSSSGAKLFWSNKVRDPLIPIVGERQESVNTSFCHNADYQYVVKYKERFQFDSIFVMKSQDDNLERRLYYTNNMVDVDSTRYSGLSDSWFYDIRLSEKEYERLISLYETWNKVSNIVVRQYVPDSLVLNTLTKEKYKPSLIYKHLNIPVEYAKKNNKQAWRCIVPIDDAEKVALYNKICSNVNLEGWKVAESNARNQMWIKESLKGKVREIFIRRKNSLYYITGKNVSYGDITKIFFEKGNTNNENEVESTTEGEESLRDFLVLGIPQQDGAFYEHGYQEDFILLQFNDWTMYKDLQQFGTIIQNTSIKKQMLFIPLKKDPTYQYSVDDIVETEMPEGLMGIRFLDYTNPELRNKIIPIYDIWRKRNSYRIPYKKVLE